jgi:hypothetical protein
MQHRTEGPWGSSQKEVVMNSVSHFLWLDIELPLNRAIRPGQCLVIQLLRKPGLRLCYHTDYSLRWSIFPECNIEPTDTLSISTGSVQSSSSWRILDFFERFHTLRCWWLQSRLKRPCIQSFTHCGFSGKARSTGGSLTRKYLDIGFFRALSYIEMLVEASCRREVMVRKLEVLWNREGVRRDRVP